VSERRGLAILARAAHGIGQAWLLVGVTLLLFFGLEFGYRGYRAIRSSFAEAPPAGNSTQHPYAAEPWWPEMRRDLRLRRNRFDPYRSHWSLPLASRYVNIDSAGMRVTPQPLVAVLRRQLFLLGGSTTWGYAARDSATIGAFLATELQRRGLSDVEVVNLAQEEFNSTQEATTLLVELAHGRIPALAVFMDGFNDIATAEEYGEPGHTMGDERIQQQLDRGRRTFWEELAGLGRHSMLLRSLRGPLEPRGLHATASVCGAVARYYRNVSLIGEALGKEFGFPVAHFLEPHHSVSRKPKTPWEAGLANAPLVPPCLASIDSALVDRRGITYFPLTDLFDRDSATVFLDAGAHLTEAGGRQVAARIAEIVAPLLSRAAPAPAPGRSQ
jgi:hypothetical protein